MNKTILNRIFNSALNGANPKKCILESIILKKNSLKIQNKSYDLNKINKIFVISFGKSSIPMAEGIKIILKNKITEGLIISNEKPKSKIKNLAIAPPPLFRGRLFRSSVPGGALGEMRIGVRRCR